MPTTKPRYAITETPGVARALASARLKWPEDRDRPSRLILRLIEEGEQRIEAERAHERQARRDAIERLAGSFPHFPPGYIENLREDWPE